MAWKDQSPKRKTIIIGSILYFTLVIGTGIYLLIQGNFLLPTIIIAGGTIAFYAAIQIASKTREEVTGEKAEKAERLKDPEAKKLAQEAAEETEVKLKQVNKTNKGDTIQIYTVKLAGTFLVIPQKLINKLKNNEITKKQLKQKIKNKLREETGDSD